MERRRDFLVPGLALATGAMDAISFLGLGGVFTSVMTGNMVLLGIGAGGRNGGLVVRAGVALLGYIAGVAAGSRLARGIGGAAQVWPRRVTVVLAVELVVILGFTSGWELTGADADGASRVFLIVAASVAMGMQSASIRELGVPGLSTTYLTGTLTATVSDLARGGRSPGTGRDLAILAAIVLGAAAGGVLVTEVPRAAPAFPLAVVTVVIIVARATVRD